MLGCAQKQVNVRIFDGCSRGAHRGARETGYETPESVPQNQSLRYATHQLKMPMGMVARRDHMMGKETSAIKPRATKMVQKTLRCIGLL
jgi:hypothetical protein